MEQAGLAVRVDAAGNIRGVRLGAGPGRKKIYLGSHLDSVPNAGAYDGILGVALAIAVVDALREVALPFSSVARLAPGWAAIPRPPCR